MPSICHRWHVIELYLLHSTPTQAWIHRALWDIPGLGSGELEAGQTPETLTSRGKLQTRILQAVPKKKQRKMAAVAKKNERSLYGTNLPPSTAPGGPKTVSQQFSWPARPGVIEVHAVSFLNNPKYCSTTKAQPCRFLKKAQAAWGTDWVTQRLVGLSWLLTTTFSGLGCFELAASSAQWQQFSNSYLQVLYNHTSSKQRSATCWGHVTCLTVSNPDQKTHRGRDVGVPGKRHLCQENPRRLHQVGRRCRLLQALPEVAAQYLERSLCANSLDFKRCVVVAYCNLC